MNEDAPATAAQTDGADASLEVDADRLVSPALRLADLRALAAIRGGGQF